MPNMSIVFKHGGLHCGILTVRIYFLIMKILHVRYLTPEKVLKKYKEVENYLLLKDSDG